MRLRELRKARGISQVKLAMDLNMNQNSISRYESGAREADYRTLIAFADYFHVSVDYLLDRESPDSFTLSPQEEELIHCYRQASPDDRAMVVLVLKKYRANPAKSAESAV